MERFGATVGGRFDSQLVTGSEREIAPVVPSKLLHLLDEPMEVELLGLLLETLQVDDDAVLALVPPSFRALPFFRLCHLPTLRRDRSDWSLGEPSQVER